MIIKGEGTGEGLDLRQAEIEDMDFLAMLVEEVDIKLFDDGHRPTMTEIQKAIFRDIIFIIQVNSISQGPIDVGCCWLHCINEKNKISSVGILLGKRYQNCGFGPYAFIMIVNHGFVTVGLQKIVMSVHTSNHQIIELCRVLGFRVEKFSRENPNHIDLRLFRQEWAGFRKDKAFPEKEVKKLIEEL